jgi:hypothetical protein
MLQVLPVMPFTRRTLLQAAAASLALGAPQPETSWRYRSLLGWITDLDSRPDAFAAWPSMRLEERDLEDYNRTFDMMAKTGFNQIVVWGLFVSDAWPLDIESAVTPERGRKVERLVEAAHQRGIKVLNGLGLYSWGFRKIIAANPQLGPTSKEAMCASEPGSWEWMRRILDYTFTCFPLDGSSMQSADRGRCTCDRCKRWSDAEYHSRINIMAADYIRGKWKNQTLGVSGWGMNFEDPASKPFVVDLSRHIDYLIDVNGSTQKRDPGYRRKLIAELKCDLGSLGGPQVEPPQHWDRDRWFLPTVRHGAEHLNALRADGGQACEYFFHILANPGDELSQYVAGRCLSQPDVPWQQHMRRSLEEIYQTSAPAALDALGEAFLAAEDAWFDNVPKPLDGTISMEPLIGDKPGPPVYIQKRMNSSQRVACSAALTRVAERFRKLPGGLSSNPRFATILRCIANVQADLAKPDAA